MGCREKCTDYSGGEFACVEPGSDTVVTDTFYSCAFDEPAQPRQCYYGADATYPYSGMCTYYRAPEGAAGSAVNVFHRVGNGEYNMHLLIGALVLIVVCLLAAINNMLWMSNKSKKMEYGVQFDEESDVCEDEESELMNK